MARAPASKPLATADESPALPERYEDALAELESLVARMESGALPLDQLLGHYQRGAQLLALCRTRLDAIEQQVKVLEDGQLKPWDAA
jgi:exodeoxyribonuclease VII small subunit